MSVVSVYVSDVAFKVLERAAEKLGRSVGDLAESAVEDCAIRWKNENKALRDPALDRKTC